MSANEIDTKHITPPASLTSAPVPANPAPFADDRYELLDEVIEDLAREIRQCEQYALGWRIKAGVCLLETKQQLPPGDWLRLFHGNRLPLCLRTAQMLMRVASNRMMFNTKFLPFLPQSLAALNELAALEPAEVGRVIRAGQIHPDLTAAQAKMLVRQNRDNLTKPIPLPVSPL